VGIHIDVYFIFWGDLSLFQSLAILKCKIVIHEGIENKILIAGIVVSFKVI
jgi:hypothetical protein